MTPVERLAREEGGRVLALLARRYGDLDLAQDAVQEALIEASTTWPRDGVPDNPGGWLHVVARRKAIDLLRREASRERRTREAVTDLERLGTAADEDTSHLLTPDEWESDERLRLMLLCCHPALAPEAQVALTLRLVGGLTTDEIAAAFLVPEATLAQRIVRAKKKIREARIPMSLPANLTERLDVVLQVLYLICNEGYLSHGQDSTHQRVDLADEALRLTALLDELVPKTAEVEGFLALQLFHRARSAARTDAAGDLVLLEDQDRTAWDLPTIRQANAVLATAMGRLVPGPYQLQAIIASYHANAPTAADTDWPSIAAVYAQLSAMTRSPVVAVNHAVAVAMADGPHAGLKMLDAIDNVDGYHLAHAARGHLLALTGSTDEAGVAYSRALDLATSAAERRHLTRRRDALTGTA